MPELSPVIIGAIIVYAIMSIVTFMAFSLDKRAAKQNRRRTPEATLHMLELVCGWPGAIAAIVLVRHKSRKLSFLAITFAVVALHAGLWVVAFRTLG